MKELIFNILIGIYCYISGILTVYYFLIRFKMWDQFDQNLKDLSNERSPQE